MPEHDPAFDPEPDYIKVTCAEEGCEFSTVSLATEGKWRCDQHERIPVTEYLGCNFPDCPEKTPLDMFEQSKKVWYCIGHTWAYNMTDQEIANHMANRKKTHSQPGGKFIISLTGEQITELKGQLERFRLGHIEAPVVESPGHLRQQVGIALKALERICNDPEGEVSKYEDGETVRWTEEVARKALQEIRKLGV